MQITPDQFLHILKADKTLSKSILDIEDKIEQIIALQPPVFFGQYTDHGINHFRDTLKMALHLISIDELERKQDVKAVVEYLSPLNVFILCASVLFHDLGMHIHFNGFKQLINGFYDDVRVEFFNELTWKEEWDNFMIEAKRFSGRERINLFGYEQIDIKDIDLSKETVDSDIQKHLIGEFIRRHHGRLAHEIALKGFPVKDNEVILFAEDIKTVFKDIFGLIARSHSMNVREAMAYLEEKFPDDPHFPHSIEVPFLMCVLRIADYFQFDNSRTNFFLIKLRSFSSPFSLNEHKAHLATQYFKTDEKDPETLYVNASPKDGVMYTKLLHLFEDIQRELDTSFAIIGEMYGRNRRYLGLRYRRIKSNLKNRKVIGKFPFVPDVYKFEADNNLFKLLVGPLYGYDTTCGVREMIQNAVDACIELQYKMGADYEPVIDVNIENRNNKEFIFKITDNGKGMSLGEIKNYYLKAGASFRNSTEWKMDYQKDDNTPSIRRTGKFGIGVLASFLVGDTIEITTRRYNEAAGYTFSADLNHEFIEIGKNMNCEVGTTILIKINQKTYDAFRYNRMSLTKWYILSSPRINYYIDNEPVMVDHSYFIELKGCKQKFKNSITLDHKDYDDIIWTYDRGTGIAINGIMIPGENYFNRYTKSNNGFGTPRVFLDHLVNFPFVSVIDRNNRIDLELNRSAVRGELSFVDDLVKQCQLDFLYSLLFFKAPLANNILSFQGLKVSYQGEFKLQLDAKQFGSHGIFVSTEGYFLDDSFYSPVTNNLNIYRIYGFHDVDEIKLLPNLVCAFYSVYHIDKENNFLNENARLCVAAATTKFYIDYLKPRFSEKLMESRLTIIERGDGYTVFLNGDIEDGKIDALLEFMKLNSFSVAQLVSKSLEHTDKLNSPLRKYLGTPVLIPHDMDKRKAYIKTLHPDLVRHIEEKRGIRL